MMRKIPVGISGRHAHVSQEHLEILFGKGHKLTPMKKFIATKPICSRRKKLQLFHQAADL